MNSKFPSLKYIKTFLSKDEVDRVQDFENKNLFNFKSELLLLLYLGVLLFITGTSLLIYEHIDTVGHYFLCALLALLNIGLYVFLKKYFLPYSNIRVVYEKAWFDYVFLFSALLITAVLGYLDFLLSLDHNLFILIQSIGLTILYTYLAYRHDHSGVLFLAISSFLSVFGITFSSYTILAGSIPESVYGIIALIIGSFLFYIAKITSIKNIKTHFKSVYFHFSIHLILVSLLHYLIDEKLYFLIIVILIVAYFFMKVAHEIESYLYFIEAIIYAYSAISFLITMMIDSSDAFILLFFYYMFSGLGCVWLILNFKKVYHKVK